MNAESRPAAARRLPNKTAGRPTAIIPAGPLQWASALIRLGRAAGPLPRYGDQEWQQLPGDDIRRIAALVVAAEAWRDHCSPQRIAEELCDDLAQHEAALIHRFRETSWDISAARDWNAYADTPTHAELAERRCS